MNTETYILWGKDRTRVEDVMLGDPLACLPVSAYLPETLERYPERPDVLYRVTTRPSWNWTGIDVYFYVTEYKILGETPYYWRLEIDGEIRRRAKNATRQFAHRNIQQAICACMARARRHEELSKTRYDEARARYAAAKLLVSSLNG